MLGVSGLFEVVVLFPFKYQLLHRIAVYLGWTEIGNPV